ncbi:WD repeat domain phosphoinositide-interacting protein 4 [Tyrophagus putrescentiae]|nr:WD repeat domain phosphoinositide-interacting protein 4 [Tyrophagus putrescentiae]
MSSPQKVLSLSINEEGNLFAACTTSSLTVFNMEPLLLHRTNLIALVAGGPRPKFADNAVLVWDDHLKAFVLEFTFAGRVLALRTTRDRLFVVERERIHVFSYPNRPERLLTLETGDNPLGLCEVTPAGSACELALLAFPGHRLGSVQLLDLAGTSSTTRTTTMISTKNSSSSASSSPTGDATTRASRTTSTSSASSSASTASVSISPTSVSAHQSEVACLALSRTGRLLATASRKGTLIRVFSTVAEYRRGLDTVTLYGLLFSPDSEYLLAWSDKGTVHLFALPNSSASARPRSGSSASIFSPLLSLTAGGEYSISKFSLPADPSSSPQHQQQQQQQQKAVYALCLDGTYHKYRVAKDGTACERENFDNYLEANEESELMLL